MPSRLQAKWKIRPDDKNGPLPVVTMRLRFKPDGTLAAAPVMANSPHLNPLQQRRCRKLPVLSAHRIGLLHGNRVTTRRAALGQVQTKLAT
jgi:hypothetical protein